MCVFKLSYVALGILQIYSIHIFFFRTIPSLVNSNPHCKTPRWRWKDRWSQQTSAGGGDSQDQGRRMCAETWLLSSATCSRRVAITYLKSAQNYMLIGYVQEKVWLSSGLGQDCDRIWAEHPAHTSRFGCQKLSCYVGELAATIGEGSTYLLWLKLFIWPNSILKWFTFCTFRRFCGIWCQCCYWRFAPAALWQRVLIFCINMPMVRVKLQTFPIILQVSPRVSESTFPSIECEQRIGHDDGCSALFNKVSVSRHSQSGVIRLPSSVHFVY